MEKYDSPHWRRARLAATGEIPFKVLNFIQDCIAESPAGSWANPIGDTSHLNSDSDVAGLRARVDILNRRLFNAEIELDVLWHATSLAKANAQRIADERDDTLISIEKLERQCILMDHFLNIGVHQPLRYLNKFI
ncbi:hypothetical protein SCHPADRAFT_455435 [Schizopora paradoxa]|uniref:Uncharacterized protein n=1 Tax=Schizopora paradoxa TaxID=27342 RepID=A0A0H2RQP5_9AGAM|nr:hypothetical protein SCHPADRAFT_455435 [Schizopora paradoxa]